MSIAPDDEKQAPAGDAPVDPEVLPKCTNPECRGITFEVVPAAPSFAPEQQELAAELDFVCCATCGVIVGIIDNRVVERIDGLVERIDLLAEAAKEGAGER